MSINYGKQNIDQKDIDSVSDVLKGKYITQGPKVEQFEYVLKTKFGSKHCCALSSGTSALHLSAIALGWSKDDIIISTPITFIASINCIVYVKATPDFVDINSSNFTIDPNKLEDKINKYRLKGKKIKAVIGVDYAGHPADWKALRYLANKFNFQLINDNCHAMGASYFNDTKYAIKYADVVVQSYHPVKHITTGEGGAIFTNDRIINKKVRSLRSHGIVKKADNKNYGSWYYEMHEIGFNYRITDMQCALGISQMKRLNDFVSMRRKIAKQYDNLLGDNKNCIIPKVENHVKHAYHLYPLQGKFEKIKNNKIVFFNKMKDKGIQLQVHYIPVHLQPYYKKKHNFRVGDFPLAENYYKREFSIPIYPNLKKTKINKIINEIKKNLI